MKQDIFEYYLHLLGLKRRKPGMDALCELVQAHLQRVPFENISKLYYKKHLGLHDIPTFELFLKGIDVYNFGGTCYANNYYLYQLLLNLGYQTILCGADMSNPDVHLVNIVTIEKQEYIIDVGYAAPFLTPLPRSLATDYVIVSGQDTYVLKPQDPRGYSHLELHREDKLKHGYMVKPMPKKIQDFESVIEASFREEATFMNALLLAHFFPDRSQVIRNMEVIETHGLKSNIRTLTSHDELGQVVSECFGIPVEITLEVVNDLGHLGDVWS